MHYGRRPLCYLVLGSVFGNGTLVTVFKYFSVNKYIRDEKSAPKQLLRLKDHHVWNDVSVGAMLWLTEIFLTTYSYANGLISDLYQDHTGIANR